MMDVFVPPQMSVSPLVMVAQSGAGMPKVMKPFTICQDIASTNPDSAWNQFSIFGNRELLKLNQIPNHKVALLQAPVFGKVVFSDNKRTPISESPTAFKSPELVFLPNQGYVGKDRAVFLVEANNRRYQVTVNFWVMLFITDENMGDTYCKQQDFSLRNDPSQSVSSWLASADLSAFLAAASGASSQITQDTTAAGHGRHLARPFGKASAM